MLHNENEPLINTGRPLRKRVISTQILSQMGRRTEACLAAREQPILIDPVTASMANRARIVLNERLGLNIRSNAANMGPADPANPVPVDLSGAKQSRKQLVE